MIFLTTLICFMALSIASYAQKGLIKKLLSNEKDTTRKASFLPVPVIGYSQEIGFEFGAGALYSFYIDRKDTLNRSSNFSGTATYSTKKTYNLTLKGDAWLPGNRFHLIGELRFKKMPFNFYGIGNNTLNADADRLVQTQFKALFEAEKMIAPSFYTGLSVGYESYKYSDQVIGGIFTTGTYTDKPGGNVGFIGISQSHDTRNSNNYPTKGFFGRVTFQVAPGLETNDYSGTQTKVNLRTFFPLSNKFVLAAQGIYYTIQGKNVPFYLLPQLGNDEIMRGYYTGRYRDENLLALQTELRYRYNNRFGAVLFVGTGTVFGQSAFAVDSFKPNYGGGLRYFFDPAKGLSVR
ncbi:MAG: polymerase, partial [Sphingobacteriales bacterium]